MSKSLEEKILKGLSKSKFYDWYNGVFDVYLSEAVEQDNSRKDAIIDDIRKLFDVDSRPVCKTCENRFSREFDTQEYCSSDCYARHYGLDQYNHS